MAGGAPKVLWYTRCPVATAFAVALRHGWLEEEFAPDGIAVRSLASAEDRRVWASHYDHSQPDSFRQGGNVPPLVARAGGADVRLIALSWTDCTMKVLVRPGSGIEQIADLCGRRVAIPRRRLEPIDCWHAAILRGFDRALASAGLSLDDVVLHDVEVDRRFHEQTAADPRRGASLTGARFMLGLQREEVAALVRGEVDAIFTEGSIAVMLEGLIGARTVVDLARLDDPALRVGLPLPTALTVSGRLLDEHPELVVRWLVRHLEAARWAAAHPLETAPILAAEVGIATELLPDALGPEAHAQLDLQLDERSLAALAGQHDFLLRHRFIAAPVDLGAFVDPAPLAAARAAVASGAAR